MKLADMPDWVQRLYWKWHGPVGHAQPRGRNYVDMSGEAIVRFFMTEGILIIAMLFIAWGISKTDWDAQAKKYLTWIDWILFGGLCIIVLLRFLNII